MASTQKMQEKAKQLRKASEMKKKLEAKQKESNAGFAVENADSVYAVVTHRNEIIKTVEHLAGWYQPYKSNNHLDGLITTICNSFINGSYMDADSEGSKDQNSCICDILGQSPTVKANVKIGNNGFHLEFVTYKENDHSWRVAEKKPASVMQAKMVQIVGLVIADGYTGIIPE